MIFIAPLETEIFTSYIFRVIATFGITRHRLVRWTDTMLSLKRRITL